MSVFEKHISGVEYVCVQKDCGGRLPAERIEHVIYRGSYAVITRPGVVLCANHDDPVEMARIRS